MALGPRSNPLGGAAALVDFGMRFHPAAHRGWVESTPPLGRPREAQADLVHGVAIITVTVSVLNTATTGLRFEVSSFADAASICSADLALVQSIRRAALCEARRRRAAAL